MARLRLLLLVLLLACGWASAARAHATRHVVIVVIDGERYSEGLGEPDLANTPREGRLMEPLGCLAECWNDGITVTVPGHAAVLSGAYQDLANDGTERPHLPTLFEYYRAATGAPAGQTWFFSNKPKLEVMAHSDHPDYGAAYGALAKTDCRGDTGVVSAAAAVLFTSRPAVLAMNLGATDLVAHSGDWPGYLAAIRTADSLVYGLWTRIESDTGLAGRTTLFVTNDHGRHDDAHGGFQSHGDGCPGCRRIQLLALGPDFRSGYVAAHAAQQTDILPTCGELLGIPTPYASGSVLRDLIVPPAAVAARGASPAGLTFSRPVPTPSGAGVELWLEVPVPGALQVDVLDAQGRQVATLERGRVAAGRHPVQWSGRTGSGRRAAPGTYFVRARLGGRQAETRVVIR